MRCLRVDTQVSESLKGGDGIERGRGRGRGREKRGGGQIRFGCVMT